MTVEGWHDLAGIDVIRSYLKAVHLLRDYNNEDEDPKYSQVDSTFRVLDYLDDVQRGDSPLLLAIHLQSVLSHFKYNVPFL